MPFRNWRLNAALGIVAVILVAWFVWEFSQKQSRHTYERDSGAAYENEQRDEGRAYCIDIPGAKLSFCQQEATPTEPRQQYSHYDLAAQQEMARWAFGLFWIGVAGLVLTALGVFFVARTLDTALASNAGFAESSTRQLRAYVVVEKVHIQNVGDPTPRVFLELKNTGQTPAHELTIHIEEFFGPRENFRYSLNTEGLPQGMLGPGQITTLRFAAPDLQKRAAELTNGDWRYSVFGYVKYFDAFEAPRVLEFCMHMPTARGVRDPGGIKDGPFGKDLKHNGERDWRAKRENTPAPPNKNGPEHS